MQEQCSEMANDASTSTPLTFSSQKQLLAHLEATALKRSASVSILAGHFMLMYDAQRGVLTPMIYQDAQNDVVRQFSIAMASDFPLRSFEIGVSLASHLRKVGVSSRLAMLVNDHAFLTLGWKAQQLDTVSRGADLRRDFYRNQTALPLSFHKVLSASSELCPDIVLRNDNPNRPAQSILPKSTIYFSEKALRRRFDNRTWPSIKTLPGFSERAMATPGLFQLSFTPAEEADAYCLTNEKGCDCSGELIELLLAFARRGFGYTVLLVPDECVKAVMAGTRAFLSLPDTLRCELSYVSVVWNIGGVAASAANTSMPLECADFFTATR
jgi:hypothetical protein